VLRPMSDHSDSPHPKADITDLYAFQKPGDPGRSILIVNVNGEARSKAQAFDPAASYELKVDADGDLRADIGYHVLFAPSHTARATAAVYRVTGDAAEGSGAIGEVVIANALVSTDGEARIAERGDHRFYAGLRSDPWFADVGGLFDNMRFTGRDTFAERNVFSIVLEVPNETLGPGGPVGVWARTVAPVHGPAAVLDQAGHPLINALFNPTPEDQHAFNRTPPSEQRERYLPKFAATLHGFGYGESEAAALAAELLPDILVYDPGTAAGYPNGRKLTDDILDLRLALITRGRVTTDLVGSHGDLLREFPYPGPPHDA
jgi:hypothetical protein